jgi:hypothetical protein
MATIYSLETDGVIWYVGSTKDTKKREKQHRLKCEKSCNAAKIPEEYEWSFKVLEECSADLRYIQERHWIEILQPLYNRCLPARTRKEGYDVWVKNNRERSNEIKAKYAINNREKINERRRLSRAAAKNQKESLIPT